MTVAKISDALLIERYSAYLATGSNQRKAAHKLGLSRSAFQDSLAEFKARGLIGKVAPLDIVQESIGAGDVPPADPDLAVEVSALRAELAHANREKLTDDYIKRKIFKLAELPVQPPEWLLPAGALARSPGVPTLFASDWHYGELVDPAQIGGVNEFNMTIAHRRSRLMITKAIDLLRHHMANPVYPGIVFALGGDMMSGNIHEELVATNEAEVMPVLLDLFGVLTWCIETLANEFGAVFVPCVTGNHGRDTMKIRAKGRNFTSFDWLLYCFLAKRFESDARVSFLIPDGPDAYYKIYNHRYLLTHGDQFRGGDGMIGALGPIIRGDHKKRGRNSQVGMAYDTLLLGHWHQLITLERLIVNSSLKGYDEYASANNFSFEPPRQAMWITHQTHGITCTWPVTLTEDAVEVGAVEWVSWAQRGGQRIAA